MPTIPLLKSGITITPYLQPGAAGPDARFLLELDEHHYLISAKARALVLALLRSPATAEQLEVAYADCSAAADGAVHACAGASTSMDAGAGAVTGTGTRHLPASQLIALASQVLPASLFADTPVPRRAMPFVLSVVLLPAPLASRCTGALRWLFQPALALPLLLAFVLLHALVLPAAMQDVHGAWSRQDAALLAAGLLLSGLWHELGHTAACRYFNCPHGAIGFGLYFVFPAWYADVSKAWRLGPRQRAVVDLGGVYFQAVLLIGLDGYALASGNPLALKLVWLITFTMLFTLNPAFKFDGYWLLSDLSGLHNLHQRVRDSTAAWFGHLLQAARKSGQSAPSALHKTARPSRLQRWILYPYAVLTLGYFMYFGLFLVTELTSLAATLPGRLAQDGDAVAQAWLDHAHVSDGLPLLDLFAVCLPVATLLAALAWPLVVLAAAVFFVDRLRRALAQITTAVLAARRAG